MCFSFVDFRYRRIIEFAQSILFHDRHVFCERLEAFVGLTLPQVLIGVGIVALEVLRGARHLAHGGGESLVRAELDVFRRT